jgi:uncharacterized membrane protein YtjA (UPF0391 family)
MKEKVLSVVVGLLSFLFIALVAALLGFAGISATAALACKVIAAVSLVLALLSIVVKRPPQT